MAGPRGLPPPKPFGRWGSNISDKGFDPVNVPRPIAWDHPSIVSNSLYL